MHISSPNILSDNNVRLITTVDFVLFSIKVNGHKYFANRKAYMANEYRLIIPMIYYSVVYFSTHISANKFAAAYSIIEFRFFRLFCLNIRLTKVF